MIPYGISRHVVTDCPCCNATVAARKSRIHSGQKPASKAANRRYWKRRARAEGKAQARNLD